jgi:hypothetical protein
VSTTKHNAEDTKGDSSFKSDESDYAISGSNTDWDVRVRRDTGFLLNMIHIQKEKWKIKEILSTYMNIL